MAGFTHISHHHPLLFNEDTGSSSDTPYDCAGCAEKVSGSSYSCGECRFYLHKRCAEALSEIQHHPAHRDHPLLLLPPSQHPESGVCCGVCSKKVKGFIYHCSSSCEFYVDINCALLPHYTSDGNLTETVHAAHPHPLVSINPTGSFKCHACEDPIKTEDASYACFECRDFFHKKCLTIDHPCHRRHQLLLLSKPYNDEPPECNLCQREHSWGYFYGCVPCKFYIDVKCVRQPPIIEDKSHHDHPFTLLLKPNDPFHCSACGDKGNYVSYTCSTCNIQVHKDCTSLPRHIKLTLHPHPISHCFFVRTDRHDSGDWDCKICFKKVNIDHGSYYCSRPGCDFIIHVQCSIENELTFDVVEVENPDEFEEPDFLSDESMSAITRVIKEIKVGDDVIATEIEHISHEHKLILSDDIKDDKYCNACVLPILSSFYCCSHCNFFLHKSCAELRRMRRLWISSEPFRLVMDGIFFCIFCRYRCSGFSYAFATDKLELRWIDTGCMCLRCAPIPHSFTYQADEPHFLFYDRNYEGKCCACAKIFDGTDEIYRCKDCTFALHCKCVTIPISARHKCDQHTLALTYQDRDGYPLRHYCDICEEERDPQKWFYNCKTCDKAGHIKCVLGKYSFFKAGSKYTYESHPHPLAFVKKIYYYQECIICGEPCQDLALECVGHGCKYIVHWKCIKPKQLLNSDSDSE